MSYKIAILSLVALQALITTALPPCVCTRNLQPVCGTNGQTYANECLLNCAKHNGAEITVEKHGPCKQEQEPCICTFEYKPVCGNDGKTYPNRCALGCERSTNPSIDVLSEGQCTDVQPTEPPCFCTDELDDTCGTDGNTYPNPCILNCETAKNPSLGIKHRGKCDNRVRVVELNIPEQPKTCACPRNLKPVCGSDGVTYNNECLLRCAGGEVSLARSAPC